MVYNGPNLDKLGGRDTENYGILTLAMINEKLREIAEEENCEIDFFQTNHVGRLNDAIMLDYTQGTDGILINPAAWTHDGGLQILDALLLKGKEEGERFPYVEVHLSDIDERGKDEKEKFRQFSYFKDTAIATIQGLREHSYYEGLRVLIKYLRDKEKSA